MLRAPGAKTASDHVGMRPLSRTAVVTDLGQLLAEGAEHVSLDGREVVVRLADSGVHRGVAARHASILHPMSQKRDMGHPPGKIALPVEPISRHPFLRPDAVLANYR